MADDDVRVRVSRHENPVKQGMKLGLTGCVGCVTMILLAIVAIAVIVHFAH